MARKGFWQRLFGGRDEPEKGKPQTPGRPDDPRTWHQADATNGADETDTAETRHDEPDRETPDETTTTRPDKQDRGQDTEDDDNATRSDTRDGDHGEPDSATPDEAMTTRPDERGGEHEDDAAHDSDPETPDPAPDTRSESETTLPETAELKTDAVGRVYAQSLLELAQDAGQVDDIAQEVGALLPLVEPGGDLYLLVTNPAISTDERSKIIARVFEGKVSDLLYRFLQVVTSKGRLGSLETILGGYLLLVSEHRGLVDVDAYVATPMDADTAARVADQIGASLGKQVTLRQHVDEALIGGLKIKVGDKLIDASVASQLRSMKQQMIAARRS